MNFLKINNLNNIMLLILYIFIIISIILCSIEEKIRKNNLFSEITLTINGTGTQQILSDYPNCNVYYNFNITPNQILVNGISQNNTSKYVYNLTNQINIITLKWDYDLNNSNSMFRGLSNITKIDLSQLKTSKINDMGCMFYECTSLESINLNNFDTSSVTFMGWMFYYCKSLSTLDLSNFVCSLFFFNFIRFIKF